MPRVLWAALPVLIALGVTPVTAAPSRPHVFLIVIDGFDPRHATPERLPTLLGETLATDRHVWRSRPSMPTVTNTNHVTLCTGVEPDAHGITGNAYWDPQAGADRSKMDDAALIQTETVFTVAERTHPELRTMAIVGKPKLGRLFSAVPDRQHAPDVLWDPDRDATAPHDQRTGYAPDDVVISALLARFGAVAPDIVLVNLPDVDRVSHGEGPDSTAAADAVRGADAAIGRLLTELHRRQWWDDAIILVTGDHGFDSVAPTADRPHPAVAIPDALADLGARDIRVAADGGVAHVYVADPGAPPDTLTKAARLARGITGVAEVFARIPIPGVTPLPADWHLDHPRAGDLVLVAAPGYQLVRTLGSDETKLRGNHGSPRERSVPLILLGGHPLLRALPTSSEVRHADIGASLFHWLDLEEPRQLDGRAVPDGSRGQAITAARLP